MVPRLALAAAIVAVFACRVRLGLHTGARQAPVGEICRLPRRLRESQYQATDAGFNQKDRVVNGIRWHYGLPEVWYSWRYVLPLLDHKYRLIARIAEDCLKNGTAALTRDLAMSALG